MATSPCGCHPHAGAGPGPAPSPGRPPWSVRSRPSQRDPASPGLQVQSARWTVVSVWMLGSRGAPARVQLGSGPGTHPVLCTFFKKHDSRCCSDFEIYYNCQFKERKKKNRGISKHSQVTGVRPQIPRGQHSPPLKALQRSPAPHPWRSFSQAAYYDTNCPALLQRPGKQRHSQTRCGSEISSVLYLLKPTFDI